jgi:hypothetical protein
MGRWAQARKRGTVKAAVSEFALSPPTPGSDFQVVSSSDLFLFEGLVECPVPADGMLVQIAPDPSGPWSTFESVDCGGISGGTGCIEDVTSYFRSAWSLGGVQISDWSTPPLPATCSA